MARFVRAGLGAALVVATAVVATPAVSAPADPDSRPGGVPPSAPTPPGPAQGDANRDKISDDFEPKVRAAAAGDRLDVIVEGVRPGRARQAVGGFALAFDLPIIDGFAGRLTAGQVRALLRVPGIERVSEDGEVRALDDAGNRDFGVDDARRDWTEPSAPLDGSGVGICVVDTGVDPGHEQLAGRVVGFFDAVNGRSSAYDDQGHGTHVAAIAAGAGPEAYRGVAPAASIYAAKVLNNDGFGNDSQVLAGVSWCTQQEGVQVISMSLGDPAPSDGSDSLSTAVNNAVDPEGRVGDVVVVAAGNSGDGPQTINAPGVAAKAITVGAVSDHSAPLSTARRDDGIWLAGFSSRGPALRPQNQTAVKPDISAPGVTVTAAQYGTTNGYVTFSGTSMAAPFVAGAVALALEADPATRPLDMKDAVMATAADRGRPGTDNEFGAGLIDVRALVDAVAPSGSVPVTTGLDRTLMPTTMHGSGQVPPAGSTSYAIVVPADGTTVPLAVTVTITSGSLMCDVWCQIGLTLGEWRPDLDLRLYSPSPANALVAESQCTLSGVSCSVGRTETVTVRNPVAGTYTLEVYEWSGSTGTGGSFDLDVSRGPLGGGQAPPPPPPPPQPKANPVAVAGDDRTCPASGRRLRCSFTLDGGASYDPDNGTAPGAGIVGYEWRLGSKVVGTSQQLTQTKGRGTYTYGLVVTDDEGVRSVVDEVVVRVT